MSSQDRQSGPESDRNAGIAPASFQAPGQRRQRSRRRWLRPGLMLIGVALLLFAGCAWFLLTAQPVELRFDPQADEVSLVGGFSLPLGGRTLARPGRYTVVASKQGYEKFEQEIEVKAGANTPFEFTLKKLPGRLQVNSEPDEATVVIDGEEAGATPLEPVKLSPGTHKVVVRARRYEVFETEIEIEGKDELQTLDVKLKPAWAAITVKSEPAGAVLKVDGEARGKTPVTEDIGAGGHKLTLELEGYETWQTSLDVVAQQDKTLPTVKLEKAQGKLRVVSDPTGASVTVGGNFRGRTPVTVGVPPATSQRIKVSKSGYKSVDREVSVASGEQQNLQVKLEPVTGQVKFSATPADAELYVDGQARGSANQTLSLLAVEHKIEVRKQGYETFSTRVTPRPGVEQVVNAKLVTPEQARIAATPAVIETAGGLRLRLVKPGSFTMGAPRREQGRRANENQRSVTLTRPYYLSTTEVTNKQFRAFRSSHSSGIVARTTLDNNNYPVVRVSWDDAVAFCNWLSTQEGLPEAYQGGELVTPVNIGYRLPTEAEWAWAARFAGGRSLKYPWGASMPPVGSAGNFADTAASQLVRDHLESYTDGFAAAAPVGRFNPNALGFYDLGGNVSEWVNDHYSANIAVIGKTETDPVGPGSGRTHVIRDSSWRDGRITELRLSYRDDGSQAQDDVGFRVARYARAGPEN